MQSHNLFEWCYKAAIKPDYKSRVTNNSGSSSPIYWEANSCTNADFLKCELHPFNNISYQGSESPLVEG